MSSTSCRLPLLTPVSTHHLVPTSERPMSQWRSCSPGLWPPLLHVRQPSCLLAAAGRRLCPHGLTTKGCDSGSAHRLSLTGGRLLSCLSSETPSPEGERGTNCFNYRMNPVAHLNRTLRVYGGAIVCRNSAPCWCSSEFNIFDQTNHS